MLSPYTYISSFTQIFDESNNGTTPSQVQISSGDTAFVFSNAALVMIMLPGLGLFYGGSVRQKNVVHTMLQSFIGLVVISIQWWFWGYSLAFRGGNSMYGNLETILLIFGKGNLLSEVNQVAPTVPEIVFMMYQNMFAAITGAIIAGGPAERLRFGSWVIFLFAWTTLVYCPCAHWVFNPNGWLYKLGFLDFAGGSTVHITSGAAALAFSILLRGRNGYDDLLDKVKHKVFEKMGRTRQVSNGTTQQPQPQEDVSHTSQILPHNIPFMITGTGLLWFGWFGFNGGSALSANGLAGSAFVVTNFAASSGALTWLVLEFTIERKSKAVAVCNGALAGLATVTPCAGYIYPGFAILCGVIASVVCFVVCKLKAKLIDDSIDPFGVHCVGGIVGLVYGGIFAARKIPMEGAGMVIRGGWWDGNFKQLGIQIAGICATFAWSFVMTTILIVIIWLIPFLGLRASKYEERIGMDIAQHDERAYVLETESENQEVLYDGEDNRDDAFSMLLTAIRGKKPEEARPRVPKNSPSSNDLELPSLQQLKDDDLIGVTKTDGELQIPSI